jgi:asparagine N-glycosylation enzyme membrane subunit Stt3
MEGAKSKGIWAGVAALLLFILVGVGLYLLGGDDQSALERLRDIAVIFIVLSSVLVVIILAGIAAALAFLVLQIKDRVIPLLEEAKGGAASITDATKRVKNTTDFVTEEAMRPLMGLVGSVSRVRSMRNVVTGKRRKPPKT